MATATKQGKEVTLTLSADQAATLLYVIGCGVGGTKHGNHTGQIYRALSDAGVEDLYRKHGYSLFEDGNELNIRFK